MASIGREKNLSRGKFRYKGAFTYRKVRIHRQVIPSTVSYIRLNRNLIRTYLKNKIGVQGKARNGEKAESRQDRRD